MTFVRLFTQQTLGVKDGPELDEVMSPPQLLFLGSRVAEVLTFQTVLVTHSLQRPYLSALLPLSQSASWFVKSMQGIRKKPRLKILVQLYTQSLSGVPDTHKPR